MSFFDPSQSNIRKSVSVAFGIFMGILPIWGFQLLSAIFLAVVLKLNKGLVIIFCQHQHSADDPADHLCQLPVWSVLDACQCPCDFPYENIEFISDPL